jgi:hypothetical protein
LEDTKLSNTARITSRTRILGWAYSTVFSGGKIEPPQTPVFTGTIAQICKQIKGDRQYQADQNLRKCEHWFYSDAIITGIDNGSHASRIPSEIDTIIKCLDREGATVYLDRKPKKHGRPKTLGETRPLTINLEEDCFEILKSLGGNSSEVIRRLLRSQKKPLKRLEHKYLK